MERIDVRELKEHAEVVVRRVREHQDTFEITYQGRAVARLVPIVEPLTSQSPEEFWAEFDRMAAEIGRQWTEGATAVDAVREQRREL